MPIKNTVKNINIQPQLFKSTLFLTQKSATPTKMECMAALNEIKNFTPKFRTQKTNKIPFISLSALGLGSTLLPLASTNEINAIPTLLVFLAAIGKAVIVNTIDSTQYLKIKDYIKSLKVFLSNCENHISQVDKERIHAQLDTLEIKTNESHARYSEKTNSKANAVQRIKLPPATHQFKPVINNLQLPSLNDVSEGIGNAAKDILLIGAAILSLGYTATTH